MLSLRCTTTLLLLAVVALSRTASVSAENPDDLCCLCDECGFPASGRDNLNVDEFGATCYDKLLEMVDPENINVLSSDGKQQCQVQINRHRQRCCDPNYDPIEIAVAPTPAPVINLPYGTEPLCDLCPDGRFPGLPKTVAAVLYIPGVNTCERLYYMGLRGLIEDRLCNPMQDYLEKDCGCADVVQAQQAPVNPAPAPTPVQASSQDQTVSLLVRKDPPVNSDVKAGAYKLSDGRDRGSGEQRRILKGSKGKTTL